ncbi:leucine-rich repeat extensin-like protein 3 [Iris pallida]|uniref:Leucine-rich repeat extensin-like protein 3 n=1 Tax=Iris pallida TaxID=29817 RepID=A0AAX6EGA8_IRIPA|nr:leucine-rich repeat extensin-like protein 3 [Iris pallida]
MEKHWKQTNVPESELYLLSFNDSPNSLSREGKLREKEERNRRKGLGEREIKRERERLRGGLTVGFTGLVGGR